MSEFEIRGIVARKTEAFSQTRNIRPNPVCGLLIELDRQSAQKPGEALAAIGIQAAAPFGDEKPVQCFERPQHRRYGAGLPDLIEKTGRRGRSFLLKTPSERHRVVQNKAQFRPSSISSLILSPPNDKPRLASRSPRNCPASLCLVEAGTRRNKLGNRFAAPRDDDLLPLLNSIEQRTEPVLGFKRSDLLHNHLLS